MSQNLNDSKIVALLRELDSNIKEPCRIVICGGAAAIVGYGLKRFTGDIDILEPDPKSESFNKSVKDLSERHSPDKAYKAHLVLSELGIGLQTLQVIKPEEISSLAELVQFYTQKTGKDADLSEIRAWQEKIRLGIKASYLAEVILKEKPKENLLQEMEN